MVCVKDNKQLFVLGIGQFLTAICIPHSYTSNKKIQTTFVLMLRVPTIIVYAMPSSPRPRRVPVTILFAPHGGAESMGRRPAAPNGSDRPRCFAFLIHAWLRSGGVAASCTRSSTAGERVTSPVSVRSPARTRLCWRTSRQEVPSDGVSGDPRRAASMCGSGSAVWE